MKVSTAVNGTKLNGAPKPAVVLDQRQLLLAAMLVASSDDAIIGEDRQSVITTWNPAAERLYGYKAEEVVGRNITFLLPPDHLNELTAVLGRVARGAGAQHYETKRIHKDGRLIDVAMTVSPIRDPAGAIVGTSTIQRDITERKRTDAAVAELAALVASSGDAMIAKTLDSVITAWNPAAARLFGYTAEEMIGNNMLHILPPDLVPELQAVVDRLIGGAEAQRYETKRLHKDGRVIDVAMTMSPICDANGTIIGTSTIARDITGRKLAEATTVEMAAIVDSSNDAIIGKTLEGVITTWNRGAEHVYGYTAREMVGKNVSLLVPDGRGDESRQIIAGMLATDKRTAHFETQRVHKDGRVIDVSLTVSPIRDSDGTIVGASSVARDVTEHNAMAEALKASELRSVLAVSRAKDEMVSLVSHELRTPLASLLGFTELLYARPLTAKLRKQYLGVMLQEGRRLTDLINDVLHLQRLEAGHVDLNLAPADLEALIQRSVTTAGEDALRPIKVARSKKLPLVMVDSDSILQVLTNLLSNARKYSPDGGEIIVKTSRVGDMVEIDIEDHGLGLPDDALPKLFGTFSRVDRRDRRLIKGTGLGLAISRKIVEAHHGKIEAHSDGPDKGSHFRFTVPAVHEAPKAADVLIVEDDSGFARLLQEQFGARGLTAVRTADAESAERLLKEGMKARAVVADLMLPGVQGEEFVTRLGADPAVPVLVLTVKSLAPREISALEKVGVTAVLPKEAGSSQVAVSLITKALVPKAPSV
jgi:two-component system, OmpR family, sensor histidine kinase VicK